MPYLRLPLATTGLTCQEVSRLVLYFHFIVVVLEWLGPECVNAEARILLFMSLESQHLIHSAFHCRESGASSRYTTRPAL